MDEIERLAHDLAEQHPGQYIQIASRERGVTYDDFIRLRELLAKLDSA